MALNSINTNIAAYNAQSNIGKASTMASSSIARLSSGSRIVRAADDVAAMSAGTSLRTNVTTLKMALINTSQGASLLQVADGALSQITDILQRQKAISVQAGSGSLSASERGFLNQEFQNLTQEIDRLAAQTNFNGVGLLDGSLSEKVDVTNNGDAAKSATGSIAFNINVAAGQTLLLNGTTVTEGIGWVRGTGLQASLDNLVTFLNASTDANLSQATYARDGNTLQITAKSGGVQGQDYRINMVGGTWTNTANAAVVNGGAANSSINLFATNFNVASVDTVVVAGPTTAAQPIGAGIITVESTTLNGAVAVTVGTRTVGMSLQGIVDDINSNTATTNVSARITGYSGAYNIQLEHKAVNANTVVNHQITLAAAGNNAAAPAIAAVGTTVVNQVFSLQGGNDLGVGAGDTVGVGVMGNDILTGQTQSKAKVQLIFPEIADADLNAAANFGATIPMGINVGGAIFTFANGGGDAEIAVGSSLAETLDNAVAAINSYRGNGSVNYTLDQITVRREGTSLVFEGKDVGNIVDSAGAGVTLALTGTAVTGSSLTNGGALNNSTTSGVTTSGITNDAFIGKIGGFTATYTGTSDQMDVSVKIGDHTYTARITDTTPAGNTTVRLNSQDGGYFDIQLAAGNGQAVSSQAGADLVAQRLNAAFESLTFYQSRAVSSYNGSAPIITDGAVTGSLIGTSVELQGSKFDAVSIDQIRVNAPKGSNPNGSITMVVNGVTYNSASNIGSSLGANQTYKLTSAENSNEFLTFTTGSVPIQFDTTAKAASFQNALEVAFGVGDGSAELAFQVGVTTADTLAVGISNVTTNKIFGGQNIDVLTKEGAANASNVLDAAIKMVTSVRAEVGAMQSRFDFAAANVESSLQNQDAARGVLLDTDIASESTAYSTAQVQLQAGIAVLAQANLLPQNLLKLIG